MAKEMEVRRGTLIPCTLYKKPEAYHVVAYDA